MNRTGKKRSGCPFCRMSKGEKEIEDALTELQISFQRQFMFDNCKLIKKLPFDFAIFPNNIKIGLIEFHGEQHYRPISYWGGEEKFQQIQKRK